MRRHGLVVGAAALVVAVSALAAPAVDLEGYPPPDGFGLFGLVNFPHASFPQLLDNLIISDYVWGSRTRRRNGFGGKRFGFFIAHVFPQICL